jgi:hypothetical protein
MMALSPELIEQLRNLSTEQKHEAMRILWQSLPTDGTIGLQPGATYEISTPYDTGNAVTVLKKMLEDKNE